MNKRAQLGIGDAPSIVLVVGLTFMVMATLAFVAAKYGESMPASFSTTTYNETLTTVTETGEQVDNVSLCNFQDFTVLYVYNQTNGIRIGSTNFTTTADGVVKTTNSGIYNNTNWLISYTASYSGTGCDVTTSLQTELDNNTSIAGIVLTISLVGIVLSVLVGVFVIARKRGL